VDEKMFAPVKDWTATKTTFARRKSWIGPTYGFRGPSTQATVKTPAAR
jgi:hypothetical protein